MPRIISQPTRITAAGNKPKLIDEYIGRMNSGSDQVSIAHMRSPAGWVEPGQTPEFEEHTVVLKGMLQVHTKTGTFQVRAGQAVTLSPGEWVQYSTPEPEGAEYIAVCLPAFSPQTVHRDANEPQGMQLQPAFSTAVTCPSVLGTLTPSPAPCEQVSVRRLSRRLTCKSD
ncbi:MAG: cupin [Planctomycetales bacterium]